MIIFLLVLIFLAILWPRAIKFLALLLLIGLWNMPSHAETDVTALLSIYTDLNEMCRGPEGAKIDPDVFKTPNVCSTRTKVSMLLWKSGYCFGKHGQSGGEAWWHKCTEDSYDFGEEWK